MSVRSIKNPGASINARLMNRARDRGDIFNLVQTRYAQERLLYRLSQLPEAEGYMLKGAMLYGTWPEHVYRPTKDIDLLGHGDPSPEAVLALFRKVCMVVVPEDGITFDPATLSVQPVREDEHYRGISLTVEGQIHTARVTVQVDIGFGDHVYPAPKSQRFPGLLPGLPEARILMYPQATVIAEKFEAMVRFGAINSRLKDYFDIWVIIRTFPLDMPVLIRAISGTFERRGATIPTGIPVGLSPDFVQIVGQQWQGYLRLNPQVNPPSPFEDLLSDLRQFFGPVIAGSQRPELHQGQWDPSKKEWT
ncbi:nucleotidyl transferase AbiEii/AbiGii toxin family protein [Pseudomonas nicosulfuronedens]|uniref:Nucleotidyl transferase AbiEii/AbiGii toxin family protein n=1 Tax=Pseudomonas nicosulfuronedens TaxID=2571105 RepID=A0A5R9QL31_9PSED|nr:MULTISPECIES: nucleotidyl transferase AbiEii/AbiGii toxin family protein [Pseudomonas]TLX70053.1 nucleotidyl transferase AbiEii/AbiGii toxin family protein [Pseudomonas nicosulfuronedens]